MSFLLDLLYSLPSFSGPGFILAIIIYSKTSLTKYPLPAYADFRALTSCVLIDVRQRSSALDSIRYWFYKREKRRIKIRGTETWDMKKRIAQILS